MQAENAYPRRQTAVATIRIGPLRRGSYANEPSMAVQIDWGQGLEGLLWF